MCVSLHFSECSLIEVAHLIYPGKILCRWEWLPTPVFLPGESHGQRSLVGYSSWVTKSQTWLTFSFFFCLKLSSCYQYSEVLVAQLCLTLCNPMNCSPPGSSIHGILQARTLKWIAIPFFKGSSWPRDQTWVFCIAGRFFSVWATKEAPASRHYNYR